MTVPDVAEKWSSAINRVTIGATSDEGGTRTSTVTVGGGQCIPFIEADGELGERPAIAVEMWDSGGDLWAPELQERYGDVLSDPAAWAKQAVEFGADMICLKLMGTHPDYGDRGAEESVEVVKAVLGAVGVPLIVWGCDIQEKDAVVLPKCASAAAGENCLFGSAKEKDYRTLVAACLADKHKLLCESPLDINIAKQVNILVTDVGYPLSDVVIFQTTGALGYGIEYCYSLMERGRTAALGGDKLLQQPELCYVGFEAWRAKECKAPDEELPGMGPATERGAIWEAITASNLLQAGADILTMRHPKAIEIVKKTIDRLWGEGDQA